MVTESVLAAPKAGEVTLKLGDPLLIYSRFDLNRMLLERAERAGAQIEKTRVTGMERQGAGWRLETAGGKLDADFCIVATGARNPLRDVGTQLTAPDTMSALGYYVQGDQARIDIQFLPDLEGYIWIFPRCGHLSVGICGKGEPASSLRKRLEAYMAGRGISWKGASFYSHLLPSLDTKSWKHNRVAGDGWMAVGDAAGLVDPITGRASTTRFDRATWRRRACWPTWAVRRRARITIAGCCGAISRPTWSSARGWPSGCFWGVFCTLRCRSAWWNSPGVRRDLPT